MTTKALGRDVLGKRQFRIHEHPVPEWDGYVRLRRITEAELTELQATAQRIARASDGQENNPAEMSRFRRSLVFTCWVDDDNQQVLTDINDMDLLAQEEFAVINAIAEAAATHNGLSDTAVEDAKKNSDTTSNTASGSG